jgi:predicted RNase H-like nuclease (RuvC/YqgF family)|tara:strand:- start:501 stop:989 length:489 start_codon:yes stop_codon:yes gene_type:complete
MGLFSRKTNPMISRTQELRSEIEEIEQQIFQLQEASNSANPVQIRTTINKSIRIPDDPILRLDEELRNITETKLEADSANLFNEQGMRKFDLYGWWQQIKTTKTLPEPNPNEKLVTYLATGRNHGYTALRRETRVARNRFILLAIVLIAVLWSILSLLIPQL